MSDGIRILIWTVFAMSFSACGQKSQSSSADNGTITPTIYYIPIVKSGDQTCAQNVQENLLDQQGHTLMKVCPDVLKSCAMEGTCFIEEKGRLRRFNYGGRINNQYYFHELNSSECQYGIGVQNICLDPFYSVAADPSLYQIGEVLFVPAVVGLKLPDGTKHSGYFIVRDIGGAIKGYGRFDFFTGFLSAKNSANPFLKLKLGNTTTHLPYSRTSGPEADQVRASRHYPH